MTPEPDPSPSFAPEEFTLRPAAGGGFGAVEAALGRKLAQLATRPERIAVFITLVDAREAGYYTQTLVDHECGAWVEAISNEFILEREHHLGADQHRLLRALGFGPPDETTFPNHHLMLDQPTDWAQVAALLIRTLEGVYGASPHCELRVEVAEVDRPLEPAPDELSARDGRDADAAPDDEADAAGGDSGDPGSS